MKQDGRTEGTNSGQFSVLPSFVLNRILFAMKHLHAEQPKSKMPSEEVAVFTVPPASNVEPRECATT